VRPRLVALAPGAVAVWLAVSVAVWLAVAGSTSAPARGAQPSPSPAPIGTRLALEAPTTVAVGTAVTVTVTLTTLGGNAIEAGRISLEINGTVVRNTRTDATGVAALSVPSELLASAGQLAIGASFSGDATRSASSVSAGLEVRPARVEIQTVPAIPGLAMQLGEQASQTDVNGMAAFEVAQLGRYPITPDFAIPESSGLRVSFARWEDDVFEPNRTLDVTGDERLVLGVRTAVRTSFAFVDLDGQFVDPALVESVLLQTGAGGERTVTTFRDVWLDSQVPVKRTFGLVAVPDLHRVSEVRIAGANVVNRGQQVWEPTTGATLTIEVLLYHLEVRVQDALLGSPLATRVSLRYPDGSEKTLPTDTDGVAAFGSLPRGDYSIVVRTGGIVPPSPIALSRPQQARIRIITTLDLGIGASILVLGVFVMIGLGRRGQVMTLASGGRGVGRGVVARGAALAGLVDARLRSLRPAGSGAASTNGLERLARSAALPVVAQVVAGLDPAMRRMDRSIGRVAANPRSRLLATAIGVTVMALAVLALAANLAAAAPDSGPASSPATSPTSAPTPSLSARLAPGRGPVRAG
jgi:Bacterial Ig-like domain (group 3)